MTRRHFVRTVSDLRGVAAPAIALLLTITACVVVVIGVIRRDLRLDTILAIVGLLLSNSGNLLADPGRHGRSTDPEPEPVSAP